MEEARFTVLVDDERTIATHWVMPPNSETKHHTHTRDYIVVYLRAGTLTVDTGTEEIAAQIAKHALTSRPAGVSHNVMNKSATPIEFIETELKRGNNHQ